jgi:diacylglycerol kinase (ATP)
MASAERPRRRIAPGLPPGPDAFPVPFTFSGRLRSVRYALRGIALMLRSQHNAWVHAAATLAVLAAGLAFGLSAGEWAAVSLAIVAVWVAEALNTAFELLCDVASPAFHPKVEQAKDVAAGAVLIAAAGAAIVGIVVFGPRSLAFIT